MKFCLYDACTKIEDVVVALANAKAVLDAIKTDAQLTEEENAALEDEIRSFKESYSDVLNKTTETVSIDDRDNNVAALNAFENLSDAAKEALRKEKILLNSLLLKIEELVAVQSQSGLTFLNGRVYIQNGKKMIMK